MEEKRAKTLEALEKFIQSQKRLLERNNADIERLKELRKDVEANAPQNLVDLGDKLNDPAFRLSELDAMPALPEEIDWSVFEGADPGPFKAMATNTREAYAARNIPPKKPLYPPSSLRQFVADSRKTILEPFLSTYRLPDDLAALSSDDEPDPEELRRIREREKIRELKKRRIEGDHGAAKFGGLGLRKPVAAVFIRRDQEDESAEVDISMAEDDGTRSVHGEGTDSVSLAIEPPAANVTQPVSLVTTVQGLGPRERRPTRKAQMATKASGTSRTKSTTKAKALAKPKAEPEEDADEPMPDAEPPRDKNGKAKPETYKQAWSVSEQHLLERLLEEIPDGEKNRWAKISKAMNGRRTARQVASRVQKYYEKLKRFGIEVGGSSSKGSTTSTA